MRGREGLAGGGPGATAPGVSFRREGPGLRELGRGRHLAASRRKRLDRRGAEGRCVPTEADLQGQGPRGEQVRRGAGRRCRGRVSPGHPLIPSLAGLARSGAHAALQRSHLDPIPAGPGTGLAPRQPSKAKSGLVALLWAGPGRASSEAPSPTRPPVPGSLFLWSLWSRMQSCSPRYPGSLHRQPGPEGSSPADSHLASHLAPTTGAAAPQGLCTSCHSAFTLFPRPLNGPPPATPIAMLVLGQLPLF